jgi:hypothetical protein
VLLVGVWLTMTAATPAMAHGEGESDQASVLVLQAIGFIVNKPGDMDDISDKVEDALDAPEKEGVDMARVEAAQQALDSNDMDQARTLLQQSLKSGPMEPATGEETGTTVVHDGLSTQGRLSGGDWVLLVVSIAVAAVGVWLALRYRPSESVRALRRQLATVPEPRGSTSSS